MVTLKGISNYNELGNLNDVFISKFKLQLQKNIITDCVSSTGVIRSNILADNYTLSVIVDIKVK